MAPPAPIDTAATYEATGSSVMRWGLAVAGVLVAAGSVYVVAVGAETLARVLGGLMAVVGIVGAVLAARWARANVAPLVTVSPLGIRDVRVAPETVPWTAVQDRRVWKQKSSTCVILTVDPALPLTFTRAARWSAGMNAMVGAKGYVINTTDCSWDDTRTIALVDAFRARYGSANA